MRSVVVTKGGLWWASLFK